ncbi:MAG: hypothetical protein DRP45_05225, partial [Candidatus Zixiibacteriota bacterium]
ILVGTGLGLSSLIGHNLGSGKHERAKKTADHSVLLGVGIMLVMAVLTFIFAEMYMGIFFDSPETIQYGTQLLRILALGFPFFGVFIMLEMIHTGVGLNTPPMVVSVIHSWGLQVLPAVVATQFLGFDQNAVWQIMTFSGVVSSIGFYVYYRRGRWLTYKV